MFSWNIWMVEINNGCSPSVEGEGLHVCSEIKVPSSSFNEWGSSVNGVISFCSTKFMILPLLVGDINFSDGKWLITVQINKQMG